MATTLSTTSATYATPTAPLAPPPLSASPASLPSTSTPILASPNAPPLTLLSPQVSAWPALIQTALSVTLSTSALIATIPLSCSQATASSLVLPTTLLMALTATTTRSLPTLLTPHSRHSRLLYPQPTSSLCLSPLPLPSLVLHALCQGSSITTPSSQDHFMRCGPCWRLALLPLPPTFTISPLKALL